MREIIARVGGEVPVIYYTKASHHLLAAVARSGADVLSVDWRIEFARSCGRRWGRGSRLQGNVDPAVLFGPAEKIRAATLETPSQRLAVSGTF